MWALWMVLQMVAVMVHDSVVSMVYQSVEMMVGEMEW